MLYKPFIKQLFVVTFPTDDVNVIWIAIIKLQLMGINLYNGLMNAL